MHWLVSTDDKCAVCLESGVVLSVESVHRPSDSAVVGYSVCASSIHASDGPGLRMSMWQREAEAVREIERIIARSEKA